MTQHAVTPPTAQSSAGTPAQFGDHLRLLRRRARLTQTELGIAVGYSPGQISMLESGQRQPDPATIAALFFDALNLQPADPNAQHLLQLASDAHTGSAAGVTRASRSAARRVSNVRVELGLLEDIPPLPTHLALRREAVQRIRRVLDQERRAVVVGMPGMGKSTIGAMSAHAWANGQPVFWLTCGAGRNLAQEDVLRQLALFAMAYGTGEASEALAHSLDAPGYALPMVNALDAVAAQLGELPQPLLVFDDAHLLQADPGALSMLERVWTLAPNCRMLFLTREAIPGMALHHIELNGLDAGDAQALLAHIQPDQPQLPPPEADALFAATRGNPMLLRLAATAWPPNAPVLELWHGTVAHSLDRYLADAVLKTLSPSARALLEFLAVMRSDVDVTDPRLDEILRSLHPDYDHASAVDQLTRRALIHTPAHALPHALIREPALAALRLRAGAFVRMHRAAAQWAVQRSDVIEAAYHFAQANDPPRALELLVRHRASLVNSGRCMAAVAVLDDVLARLTSNEDAGRSQAFAVRGELLINTLRAQEAADNLHKAMQLASGGLERARIAELLARHLHGIGQYDECAQLCEDAERLLDNLSEPSPDALEIRLKLNGSRIKALTGLSRFDEAERLCHVMLGIARELGLQMPRIADEIRARARLALAYLARLQGKGVEVQQHAHEAARLARAVGLAETEAFALVILSAAQRDMGDLAGSERNGLRAVEVAEATHDAVMTGRALHWLSVTSYMAGDYTAAVTRSRRAADLLRQLGDTDYCMACELLEAVTHLELGELAAADAAAQRIETRLDLLQSPRMRGYAHFIIATVIICWPSGLARAEMHLARALAIDALHADHELAPSAQAFVAATHVAAGRLADAEAMLSQLRWPAHMVQVTLLHALVQAMLTLAQGHVAQARAQAQDVLAQAQRVGYRVYVHDATRLLAVIDSGADVPLAELPRRVMCAWNVSPTERGA